MVGEDNWKRVRAGRRRESGGRIVVVVWYGDEAELWILRGKVDIEILMP